MEKAKVLNDLLQIQKMKNRISEIDTEIKASEERLDKLEKGTQDVYYDMLPTDYEKRKKSENFNTIEEYKADMIKRANLEVERYYNLYGVIYSLFMRIW